MEKSYNLWHWTMTHHNAMFFVMKIFTSIILSQYHLLILTLSPKCLKLQFPMFSEERFWQFMAFLQCLAKMGHWNFYQGCDILNHNPLILIFLKVYLISTSRVSSDILDGSQDWNLYEKYFSLDSWIIILFKISNHFDFI